MSDDMEIIIDNVDNYKGLNGSFYLPSDRMEHLKYLNDESFNYCYIRNTPTEYLTTLNLSYLNQKLKDGTSVEVIIDQPIKVMQRHDERQIKMNALYSGFGTFETKEQKFVEPLTDINYTSLILTFKKEKRVIPIDYEKYHIKPYRSIKKNVRSTTPKNKFI